MILVSGIFVTFAVSFNRTETMGRQRKSKVEKSPFKLRRRTLADGRESLFIDHAVDGKHHYEFLQLYLLPGDTGMIQRENAKTLRKAEEIVRAREEAFISEKSDARHEEDLSETLLSDFMDILIADYKKRGMNSYKDLSIAKYNLHAFRPDARMCDIDRRFCTEYRDWLKSRKSPRTKKPLAKITIYNYFWCFGSVLANAFHCGYIKSNPWSQLEHNEKLQDPPQDQDFLTIEEVEALEKTPYDRRDDVRRAFLFCCFCGLRISDVMDIRWENLSKKGRKTYLTLIMKKTKKTISVPVHSRAIKYLPKRGKADADEKIFPSLPTNPVITKHLRNWAKAAKVDKKLHFHMSRHTYGTMLVTAGVDLYTASKLMGHADIRTTQVYAQIVDKKKEEAMNLLDNAI